MKVQLLPSSFGLGGAVSQRQHLSCLVIDDSVAFDAGSLAFSCSDLHRELIRDIFLSHAHLDHIAGLPIYLDDLFSVLTEPVRVHATAEMIDVLERDVFNWSVYPKFSKLRNSSGPVIEYRPFMPGTVVPIKHLNFMPVEVNHNVPSVGVLVSDNKCSIGITGDTAHTDEIWKLFSSRKDLAAVLIECAFPDELAELAGVSHHLTPSELVSELFKFGRTDVPVYVINIKPMYRERVNEQIKQLNIAHLEVLEIGRDYEF
ncbi:MAG: 3',5'-cyclic-nucleotide phosphodiesterase [Acidobacteriota bacterium]